MKYIFSFILVAIFIIVSIVFVIGSLQGNQENENTNINKSNSEENTNSQSEEERNIETSPRETEETIINEVYEGEYLTADLPDEWRIEEFTDEEGIILEVEGSNYEGFTGFKIYKENEAVFEYGGVDGTGALCFEAAYFPDSDPEIVEDYLEAEASSNTAYEGPTVDLGSNYNEYNFGENRIRLVEGEVYIDKDLDPEFFDVPCGFATAILSADLSYTATPPGTESAIYTFDFNNDLLNDEEIDQLFNIIDSIEIKN